LHDVFADRDLGAGRLQPPGVKWHSHQRAILNVEQVTGRRVARASAALRQVPPLSGIKPIDSKLRAVPICRIICGSKKHLVAARQELRPAAGDQALLKIQGIL
jgi:hypothetical protein